MGREWAFSLFTILPLATRPDLDPGSLQCQHPSVCFYAQYMQMLDNLFYKTIFIAVPSAPSTSCDENHLDAKVLLTKLFPVARMHRCMSPFLPKFKVLGGRRHRCSRALQRHVGVVWGQKAFNEQPPLPRRVCGRRAQTAGASTAGSLAASAACHGMGRRRALPFPAQGMGRMRLDLGNN